MKILQRLFLVLTAITMLALLPPVRCHAEDTVADDDTGPDPAKFMSLLTGGRDAAELEIKFPAKIETIHAKVVRNLGKPPKVPYEDVMDCVFRRMTKNCFEAWTPAHGWLFSSDGSLVNEALPRRSDGIGREWHGAFLPDRSWVTTDLGDHDCTLTFFSRHGKQVRALTTTQLTPPSLGKDRRDTIAWGRCDKDGRGWVVLIGQNGGWATVFVTPDGKSELLKDPDAAWKLCQPRDLEPKGDYTALFRPNDDFTDGINFTSAAHGEWLDFPTFRWDGGKVTRVIQYGDHNFGFLPGSHDVFIGATQYDSPLFKTWFLSANGACLGWVSAEYLADAPDGRGIWLRDGSNRVLALGPGLTPLSLTRFLIEGKQAAPAKLFPDLRLGFFTIGGQVVLARW